MKTFTSSSLIFAAALAFGPAAMAQPMGAPGEAVVASPPVPDTSRETQGIPGPDAVNPAPGRNGPYVGAGPANFYDVDARIAAISSRLASLPPSHQRAANAVLRQVKAEERTQRARHGGELRDWDRENLNAKLDTLVHQYPMLSARGAADAAQPAQ